MLLCEDQTPLAMSAFSAGMLQRVIRRGIPVDLSHAGSPGQGGGAVQLLVT
jgi:hypothetical protein